MTDYKQLCTELLQYWDDAPTPSDFVDTNGYGTIQRIRAALAKPERQPSGNHPITPPPELVREWAKGCSPYDVPADHIATQAARWGADMELEACCADLRMVLGPNQADWLHSVRRPQPPSLKEQALQALYRFDDTEGHEGLTPEQIAEDFVLIRRALEALPD